jgi:hypothetical protein
VGRRWRMRLAVLWYWDAGWKFPRRARGLGANLSETTQPGGLRLHAQCLRPLATGVPAPDAVMAGVGEAKSGRLSRDDEIHGYARASGPEESKP